MKKINLILPLGVLFLASCGNGNNQNSNAEISTTPTSTPPTITVENDNDDTSYESESSNLINEYNTQNTQNNIEGATNFGFYFPHERLYMMGVPGILNENPDNPDLNGPIEFTFGNNITLYSSEHLGVDLLRIPVTINNLSNNETSINNQYLNLVVTNPSQVADLPTSPVGRLGGPLVNPTNLIRYRDINTYELILPPNLLEDSMFQNTILAPNESRQTYMYIAYFGLGEYQIQIWWRGQISTDTAATFSVYVDF